MTTVLILSKPKSCQDFLQNLPCMFLQNFLGRQLGSKVSEVSQYAVGLAQKPEPVIPSAPQCQHSHQDLATRAGRSPSMLDMPDFGCLTYKHSLPQSPTNKGEFSTLENRLIPKTKEISGRQDLQLDTFSGFYE